MATKRWRNMASSGTRDEAKDEFEEWMSMDPNRAWEHLKGRLVVDKVEPLSPEAPVSDDKIRFVCMSDTHNRTDELDHPVPKGDVFLHAGDFTLKGSVAEARHFNHWLGTLPHKHRIVIAGNHERVLDVERSSRAIAAQEIITNATYLEDSFTVVHGIKIYGAPWTPEYYAMAFNLARGDPLREKWANIPEDVDVLMTHGPPLGYGDLTFRGERTGCVDLLRTIQKVKPKYHIYGHIHEGFGMTTDGSTFFVNASTCDLLYKAVNPALVFDLPLPPGMKKR